MSHLQESSAALPSASTTGDSSQSQGVPLLGASTYFYGFLITFVGMMFFFVICGTFTRRRFGWGYRGQRRPSSVVGLHDLVNGWEVGEREKNELAIPPLWDRCIAKSAAINWHDIMPLSGRMVSSKEIPLSTPSVDELQSRTSGSVLHTPQFTILRSTRNGYGIHGITLPVWIQTHAPQPSPERATDATAHANSPRLASTPPKKQAKVSEKVELPADSPSELQITVMISMPRRKVGIQDCEDVPPIELGTTRMPWDCSADIL